MHFFLNWKILTICVKQIYQCHFPKSIYSFHISASHFGNSQTISNSFITIFVTVICDQWSWCYSCHCFEIPLTVPIYPYRTVNLIICYMCSECHSDWSFSHLTLLGLPYTMRHNNIEIRPMNNSTISSKWKAFKWKEESHSSHFKLKAVSH